MSLGARAGMASPSRIPQAVVRPDIQRQSLVPNMLT